ncbi:MAG: hypothetical protein AB7S75_24865 [Desulfococcaceae bacterium]
MKKMIFVSMMAVLLIAGNASAFDMKQIKIHGFVSQGWLQTDQNDFYFAQTEDGTFQFNETGINFASELTDSLRIGIQFLSRDLGELGNNEVDVDWAFADYRFRNWLGIRAGKIKKPYGLYNHIRDVDAARTGIFLPMMIYDDVPRETFTSTTGIGIYGTLQGGFSYEIQYGTAQIDADGGTAVNMEWFAKTEVIGIEAENSLTAFLAWATPIDGLTLAGTVFQFPDITYHISGGKLDLDSMHYILSAEYCHDRFTFAAEYKSNPFTLVLNDALTLSDQTTETWYGSVSYRVSDLLTLGTYYGEAFLDKDNKDLKSGRKDWALTARFDITDNWVFKVEGHKMRGLAQVTTPPEDASEDWFLFAAKATFSF